MNKMNIGYCDCIKIIKGEDKETQDGFKKMVTKWEKESNLRCEQAYFSFTGVRIWISENKMMSTAEAISEVLSC